MDRRAESKQLAEQSEVIRLIKADTVPWYKKPNLRFLYLCLIPAALGVEMTTGYDGSVLNGLQAVATWQTCKSSSKLSTPKTPAANNERVRLQLPKRRSSRCGQRIV